MIVIYVVSWPVAGVYRSELMTRGIVEGFLGLEVAVKEMVELYSGRLTRGRVDGRQNANLRFGMRHLLSQRGDVFVSIIKI